MKSLLSLLALTIACTAFAANLPFVSPLIGEHMMFQRDQPNRLWGWTEPGAEVTATFAGQKKSALAGSDGRWLITLDPLSASAEPRELLISAHNEKSEIVSHKFGDVLVGDLWLCSGQSNMAWGLNGATGGAEQVKNANFPQIRLLRVNQQVAYAPLEIPQAQWKLCESASFDKDGAFSAVAYFFGRKVHQGTGIPVGLVQAAVGGSPAESFMSPAALQAFPEFQAGIAEIERLRKKGAPTYGNFVNHWYDEFDRGIAGDWGKAELETAAWKPVSLKEGFAQLGVAATPAVVWFRREIILPDPLPAGQARLLLGVVEKMDTAFINGKWIGASAWVENPRAYNVPADALKPGRNTVAIRVLKTAPDGGFRTAATDLKLTLGDGTAIPLEGEWRAIVSVDAKPPHPLPLGYENWPVMPLVLHYGMIRPLAPLALKGVLWYQGEANFTRAKQYRTLLPAMIADWRALFHQPDLPFYIVSLPGFMQRKDQPGSDGWNDLREAQALTAKTVPHAGLAVTIDLGDANDIHPRNKLPVGERLALVALRDTYGKDVVASGPVLDRTEKIPGGFRLHFKHTEGGLVVKGDKLGEFSLAGADKKWVWAEAKLESDSIVVTSSLSEPVAVRYAWQANPLATLFNGAGLPAAPFRTDDW